MWGLVPLLLVFMTIFVRLDGDIVEGYVDIIPFVQCAVLIDGAAGDGGTFHWIGLNALNILDTLIWLLVCFAAYSIVGAAFLWRAKVLLRKKAMS